MSPRKKDENDLCLMCVSGEVLVKVYAKEGDELELYSASMKKGDFIFIPRGTSY